MMFLLILGIVLWIAAHLFKRVAPARRAAMGEKGKGVVAGALFIALILIIIGFRGAPDIQIWNPPAFMVHINNLLMLVAFYLFGISMAKGRHAQRIRHPQLTAVKTWAVAHLLVNGDLASILLFGGMLGWAVAEVVLINKAEPVWTKPTVIRKNGDLINLAVSFVVFAIVGGIHVMLGLYPFG